MADPPTSSRSTSTWMLIDCADPYALFAAWRAAGPLLRTPSGFVVATSWQAAMDALRDRRRPPGLIGQRYRDALPPGAARRAVASTSSTRAGPPAVRALVSKAFTPRRHELRPLRGVDGVVVARPGS
ncbi:MAG: hypothetical protein R2690_04320 [Acidimicrobiales bacterium]